MNDTTKLAKRMWRAALAIILVLSMLGAASVMCFAETTETEETVTWEFKDMNLSIGENIVVKFYTSATTGDGSKLEVKFNGYTHEITENVDGVFEFYGVTPQMFNETMVATLYNPDGNKADETEAVSVKSYLEGLLARSYENSGCKSTLQYDAMRELCVNMLNYGAAAQEYVDHDVENLANAGLTDAQKALATEKIEVTDTDKAVSGTAWVGAGVRFDYTLGLYFVFKAASANEYTATLNGEEADVEAYEALGDGYYVIRYNSFNVTGMNKKVTAKLTKDGEEAQTFTYSIKSYVASKGNSDSKIANLVNATYTYGYAAVAYSAEYVTTDPTFEKEGSISMDAKGYDFSNTKYGTVTLPKLDFTNYTVETKNNGTELAPEVTTTFTLNDDTVAYPGVVFKTDNCISLEGKLYSQYDLANFKFDDVTVSYDTSDKSYTYDVADGKTANPTSHITSYGADLTITGNVEIADNTAEWGISGVKVTMGTAEKAANVTLTKVAVGGTSIRLKDSATLHVSEDSTLTVDPEDTGTYSIYFGANSFTGKGASQIIVDGTVTCTSAIRDTYFNNLDETAEYGFSPNIYVRKGTLETAGLLTYSLQVGSEILGENGKGTLILTADGNNAALQTPNNEKSGVNFRWVFANGTVTTQANATRFAYAQLAEETYIDIRKGMTFNLTQSGYNLYTGYYSSKTTEGKKGSTASRYVYVEKGATYNLTNSLEMIQIYKGKGQIYLWEELTAHIDGYEKTIRVVNYTKDAAAGTKITSAQCNAIIIEANTAITSSATTKDMGTLGTFIQGTYGDGQTVWYQIVD